ncbi:MAG: hypothetical protein OEY77_06265 [Nitrospira sp.]|nr:hypothetical protein [Nitrospira sp.]
MRSKQLSRYTVFALFIIACSQAPTIAAAGGTAKAGLAQAQEAAHKWKPDATLVQVITLSGNVDGTAGKWTYVFHSPEAKRGYQVAVSNGKIVQELGVSVSFTDPVDLEFVDSAQAVAEAKHNELVVKGDLMMMLLVELKNTKNEGTYWNILGDMNAEMSLLINAKTGKFFRKKKFQ